MAEPATLPQYFLAAVERYGDRKVALRQKELGIWQEWTWRQSYDQVRSCCLGLVELGLKRGDRVAIVGDNDRQYVWADLALLAAGACTVGIFTDATPAEIEYIVSHSDATFVLAKDQEQCDKLLAVREQLPLIKKIIYWDPRGLWGYHDPWLMDFAEAQRIGREVAAREPDKFESLVADGKGDDLAIICYTSGTTGLPKGAMLTHANLIYNERAFLQIDPRYEDDNHLSFLPLAWISEHVLGITPHVTNGLILNFPEEPETVQQNIREIAPQGLLYNSRLWENLVAAVQVRINDSAWLNRALYRWFLPVGYAVADRHFKKQPIGAWLRLLYTLGTLAVFRPLRDQLGLIRARVTYTAGAALSPDVLRFFRALGINLKQIYGSTEVAGGAIAHRDDDIKFESVGKPIPGCDLKISEEGEILLSSPGLFQGYHKNPEATQAAIWIDETGRRWFRTGDAGTIDPDGHLIYLDRVKDMIRLAGGEKYSAQYIEGRLKFSPYIRDAMTIGGADKDYVTALINIDFDNVGRWAEKHGISYTTFVDLSQKPQVYDLIRADVEQVNRTLPPGARVRKFMLMHKEFDADEGELTRTRKLRRGFLAERYQDLIAAMYGGLPSVPVSATVKYRDGRVGTIDTTVRVAAV